MHFLGKSLACQVGRVGLEPTRYRYRQMLSPLYVW
jgi:hypothetical protein